MSELTNGDEISLYKHLVSGLKALPNVSRVVAYTAPNYTVASSLQEYQSLVQQHVNLIVYQPAVASAFIGPVKAAAAAGIPSVAIEAQVDSPDSVNVTGNTYLFGAEGGAHLFAGMNGHGNVLQVNGLVGTPLNASEVEGFTDAKKLCSGIHVAGQVAGDFTPSLAQGGTLSFLSSHPEPVTGAWEAGGMATPIVNAFTKLGRTVPPIAGNTPPAGFLGYWASRASSGYKSYMYTVSEGGLGTTTAYVAGKMLKGDGVRINSIVLSPIAITSSSLSSWVTTKDPQSNAAADGPPSVPAQQMAYAAKFFRR